MCQGEGQEPFIADLVGAFFSSSFFFFQELFGFLEFKIVLILFYLNDIGMSELQRLGLIIYS